MAKIKFFMLILLLFALCPIVARASLTATVSTENPVQGENFQLEIRAEGDNITSLDLGDLQRNFVITGRQESFQQSIVQGRRKIEKTWIFNLKPVNSGQLTIPAIYMGREKTLPITLQVAKGSGNGATLTASLPSNAGIQPRYSQAENADDVDVFIEGSVETKHPYVQGQIVFVARLYSATKIEQGSWPPPQVVDAFIEPLGEDMFFNDNRNGRIYNVIERRYAIFPQKSGTFEIPSSVFNGTVFSGKSNDPFENMTIQFGMGAASAVLGAFGSTEPVEAKSKPITLNILPKPDEFQGRNWLPAYGFKISESFDSNINELKVNEAVSRTVTIEAQGLLASQLPDISLGKLYNAKVYPGKAEKSNSSGDKGVISVLKKSEVIIPLASGELYIPEVKIDWWNVPGNKMETAVLPARKIMVASGSGELNSGKGQKTSTVAASRKNPENLEIEPKANTVNVWLIGLIGFGFIVFLALVFLFLHNKKLLQNKTEIKEAKSQRQYFKELEEAISSDKDNPKQVADALMQWARKYWEESPPINVTAIAERLKSAELKKELEELNQSIYARGQGYSFDKDRLFDLLTKALNAKEKQKKQVKPVPDLYPM